MTDRPRPYESPVMIAATGATIRPGGPALTERALALCAFEPGASVLDVGCGLGASVSLMRERHGLDARGVDLSAALIAQGLARWPGLPLQVAGAAALPFADGTMDGVLMECVLSVTGDVGHVLGEAWRVLRPQGRLVLSDMYSREIPSGPDGRGHEFRPSLRAGRTARVDYSGLPCMAGALSRAELEGEVDAAGFELSSWEDHTGALKSLAAEIILEHGSLAHFWALVGGRSCEQASRGRVPGAAGVADRGLEAAAGPPERRLGYYLAIAVRR